MVNGGWGGGREKSSSKTLPEKENRIDNMGRLQASEDINRGNQMWRRWREEVLDRQLELGGISGARKKPNTIEIPGIYKDDSN